MDKPGMLQALVNALRSKVGLGDQQTPGPATNVQNGYRQYQMAEMERGGTPVPFEQWIQQQGQQMPVSTPR